MSEILYNDNQIIDENTAKQLASAYSAMLTALKTQEQQNNQTSTTVETLLSQILAELKLIREQMAINKKIRLG